MLDYKPTWYYFDSLLAYALLAFIISGLLIYLAAGNPESHTPRDELNDERLSMYECGFDPFKEPQETYLTQFFVVAVLFLIFDIEILYLLPWAVAFETVGTGLSLALVSSFFVLICAGLLVEWKSETLNWIKSNFM